MRKNKKPSQSLAVVVVVIVVVVVVVIPPSLEVGLGGEGGGEGRSGGWMAVLQGAGRRSPGALRGRPLRGRRGVGKGVGRGGFDSGGH